MNGLMPTEIPSGANVEAIERQFEDISPPLSNVFDYWNTLRDGRPGPRWREFDLMALPLSILPTTQVVDWLPESGEFRYRFYGSSYTTIHGVDLTDKSPKDLPMKQLGHFIHNEFLTVVHNEAPNLMSYGFRKHGVFTEIETCLRLPLSDDGHTITGIVTIDSVIGGISTAQHIVDDLVAGKALFRKSPPTSPKQ